MENFEDEERTLSISEAYQSWARFRHSSRELWLLLFVKLIESFAMTSEDLVFMLYLREEMFTQREAGLLYSATALLIFVYGVTLAGFLIDAAGVKASLIVGSLCSLLARAVIGLARDKTEIQVAFLTLVPLGMALCKAYSERDI